MPPASPKSYQRTTIYMTAEQRQWLRHLAAQAQLNDVPLSASDVVRLAITRLRDQLSDDELRKELIAHVRAEVKEYPGRARRGLPKDDQTTS
jgi:uncharacterized protein (DUF2267 family)